MVHSVVFYYTFWMSGADVLPPSALPTAAGAPGALLGEARHVLVNHRLREAVPLIFRPIIQFFLGHRVPVRNAAVELRPQLLNWIQVRGMARPSC